MGPMGSPRPCRPPGTSELQPAPCLEGKGCLLTSWQAEVRKIDEKMLCGGGEGLTAVAESREGLVWKNGEVPPPHPTPCVPSLTFILANSPPAGHPTVTSVLKLVCGVQEADGLDMVVVVDRRRQLQQGDVVGI